MNRKRCHEYFRSLPNATILLCFGWYLRRWRYHEYLHVPRLAISIIICRRKGQPRKKRQGRLQLPQGTFGQTQGRPSVALVALEALLWSALGQTISRASRAHLARALVAVRISTTTRPECPGITFYNNFWPWYLLDSEVLKEFNMIEVFKIAEPSNYHGQKLL